MKKNIDLLILLLPILLILIALPICSIFAPTPVPTSTQYPMTGIVTNVDRDLDIVTFEDCTGHLWDFYGAEDWEEGDICSCIMNDMGTPLITDDEIVDEPKYSGCFEMWG